MVPSWITEIKGFSPRIYADSYGSKPKSSPQRNWISPSRKGRAQDDNAIFGSWFYAFHPCDPWLWASCVDGHSVHAVRGVEHGFGQRGMRVDRPHQVFDCGFEFHRRHCFCDQFCRLRADDVDAENFTVVGIADDFDEAFVLSNDAGAGVSGEGELADFHVVSGF